MEEETGCWKEKAAYERCFDKWYSEVFLQRKAEGKVGCQKEYVAYTRCYKNEINKTLMDNVKSVMQPEVRERFEAEDERRS